MMYELDLNKMTNSEDHNIEGREEVLTDFTEAEALVSEAENTDSPQQPKPGQGELVELGSLDIAKGKGRALVAVFERFFKWRDPRISFGDEVYDAADRELAPAIAKHNLSEAGPMKYTEEASAIGFLGGLLVNSVQQVRALDEQDAQRESQETQSNGG